MFLRQQFRRRHLHHRCHHQRRLLHQSQQSPIYNHSFWQRNSFITQLISKQHNNSNQIPTLAFHNNTTRRSCNRCFNVNRSNNTPRCDIIPILVVLREALPHDDSANRRCCFRNASQQQQHPPRPRPQRLWTFLAVR